MLRHERVRCIEMSDLTIAHCALFVLRCCREIPSTHAILVRSIAVGLIWWVDNVLDNDRT